GHPRPFGLKLRLKGAPIMTRNPACPGALQFGCARAAWRRLMRTTRAEYAPRRRIDRRRNLACHADARARRLAAWIRDGRGGDQRLGVGMARVIENRIALADLHDATEIHNHDAVTDAPH